MDPSHRRLPSHESYQSLPPAGRLLAQLVLNGLALAFNGTATAIGGGRRERARGDAIADARGGQHPNPNPIHGAEGGRTRRGFMRHTQWGNASTPKLGYCAETSALGDCSSSASGYWEASSKIYDLHSCARACGSCARCRYVSYSAAHADCSWFYHCSLPLELEKQGDQFQTLAVKTERGDPTATPAPRVRL